MKINLRYPNAPLREFQLCNLLNEFLINSFSSFHSNSLVFYKMSSWVANRIQTNKYNSIYMTGRPNLIIWVSCQNRRRQIRRFFCKILRICNALGFLRLRDKWNARDRRLRLIQLTTQEELRCSIVRRTRDSCC
jgi:hypothetical protein